MTFQIQRTILLAVVFTLLKDVHTKAYSIDAYFIFNKNTITF